jgi:type VI secretion system secreted protein Hcp
MPIFLKVDGIPGESVDDKHKNEIDVESWSWGLTQTGGVGRLAGTPSFSDFHFTKRTDRASVPLFFRSASGARISEATLTVSRDGEARFEFLTITFSDLLVSSFQQGSAEGAERPTEQISFNYEKIKVEYIPVKADGTADAPVSVTWDLKKNEKV